MGALGNGRRGGRSPSLLMAALIACVLLLGFNYWVSNSRNIELQSKILELEDHMRMLTAERDSELRSKMKAEDEMRIQNEKMEIIKDTQRRQQDTALNNWIQEKETLKHNISSTANMMQEMKEHMKSLLEDLGKVQNELKSCQSNSDTLTTQCNKQIESIKEKCGEKTEDAELEKLTAEKEPAHVVPENAAGSEKSLFGKTKSELPAGNRQDKNEAEFWNNQPDVESELMNENKDNNEKAAVIINKSPTTSKPANKNETLNRPANDNVPDAVRDTLVDEVGILEPKNDDIVIGEDEEKVRVEEGKDENAIMYDNDGEIEKQLSKIKDENQEGGQELEDDMANYNGDDDNQPESEDEKQAELAGM
nr:Golgi membrane protein 1 [Misgurnus anguillicaudatus]